MEFPSNKPSFRRGPRMVPLLLGMRWSKSPTAGSSWTCTIERKRQIPIQALFGHVLVYSAPHFVLPWRISLSMAQIHERGHRCWWWNRNNTAVSGLSGKRADPRLFRKGCFCLWNTPTLVSRLMPLLPLLVLPLLVFRTVSRLWSVGSFWLAYCAHCPSMVLHPQTLLPYPLCQL